MIRKIRLTLSELNSMYIKLRTKITRFPTGVDNMGGALQNLMEGGGGLKSIQGVSMGGLKYCGKIPVKEFIL